jgi:hypothetical protein
LCYAIHGGQGISPTKGVAVAEGEFDEIEALKKSIAMFTVVARECSYT